MHGDPLALDRGGSGGDEKSLMVSHKCVVGQADGEIWLGGEEAERVIDLRSDSPTYPK